MSGKTEAPLPDSVCINCGAVLNDATPTGDDKLLPEVNDVTICVYCLRVMIYGEGLKLRDFTDEEFTEMLDDGTWQKLMAMREAIRLDKEANPRFYPKYKP